MASKGTNPKKYWNLRLEAGKSCPGSRVAGSLAEVLIDG